MDFPMLTLEQAQIGIIGLGYVGLPLAVEFGKKFHTTGFDLNTKRLAELTSGTDSTLEVSDQELREATKLSYTSDLGELQKANTYIIAVPTPIDSFKRPDFKPLIGASHTVGKVLERGNVVIYESTVYPGATEEICVPILEKESGFRLNTDFYCGYSPERINPGDKKHRLPNIVKVTSGSTPEAADFVDSLYKSIITAGTFMASSIKVAEAAKVIENTQRDVNIALVNEHSLIFNRLGINTLEVLEAAGTKWNFLPFRPGLVGGHCIGVDPYYLTHKAQEVGYQPDMILAGRRLNDNMGSYIASQVIKMMVKKGIDVARAEVLVMGLTFKEDCPDLRNTKVVDIINEFRAFGIKVEVHDPWVNQEEAEKEYGVSMVQDLKKQYDGIVFAVAHHQFREMSMAQIRGLCKELSVLYDVKNIFPSASVDGSL
jgi:UDP-N-acetyl-D-glucosamine/UDP-N-acetyl-D-galactosamine dehydrogenase